MKSFIPIHWAVLFGSLLASFIVLHTPASIAAEQAKPFNLTLRYQQETGKETGMFHRLSRSETWNPNETAIIVCDMWDYHHCYRAVQRGKEIAPRLNNVLKKARQQGATIIHAPSDCMAAYVKHPARHRAQSAAKALNLPKEIQNWCSRIPSEEQAVYPIDQSNGGEDDTPEEHAAWEKELAKLGRNPALPWLKQTELIEVDAKQDYISDKGDEVWNVLQSRGIKNVILAGVHVNMCVLGRPFGLRQMAQNNMNVVLMRDMTDTMYDPKQWPYVSHFTGTDLIVEHIEKYVCPTITSDQFLGGKPFRFKKDKRPHVAIIMAEDEYELKKTLPVFAREHLGKSFRYSFVHSSAKDRNDIPGLEVLSDADVAIFGVRRRVLPATQMKFVKDFEKAGKPIIGLRTSSHAFSLRKGQPPEGYADWPSFDADVFGGNYHGHHGNSLVSTVKINQPEHVLITAINSKPFQQGGSLYKTSPLKDGTTVLMTGTLEGQPEEPVTWIFKRKNGGKSFYSSLGHKDDFTNPKFVQLLLNAVHWAVGSEPTSISLHGNNNHWQVTDVPSSVKTDGVVWYRCVVNIPNSWTDALTVKLSAAEQSASEISRQPRIWINGHQVDSNKPVSRETLNVDDANLVVIRMKNTHAEAPVLISCNDGKENRFALEGRWQFRVGDDESWSNMPLPAKFGGPTDIYFSLAQ